MISQDGVSVLAPAARLRCGSSRSEFGRAASARAEPGISSCAAPLNQEEAGDSNDTSSHGTRDLAH
jgi:hypothetical protein